MRLLSSFEPSGGIIEFTAFLLRHISAIDPKLIVLIFNNDTSQSANHILVSLVDYKKQCINTDIQSTPITNEIGSQCDLLIHFVNNDSKHIIKLSLKTREFILKTTDDYIGYVRRLRSKPNSMRLNYNQLLVQTNKTPINFITAQYSDWTVATSKQHLEPNLVASFYWLAFLRHVEKLSSGYSLYGVDDINDQTYGVADNELSFLSNDSKIEYVSGFKVGIYKIFAEKLSGNSLSFWNLESLGMGRQGNTSSNEIRFKDKRLAWRYLKQSEMNGFHISFTMTRKYKVFNNVQMKRYVIIVPRIVIKNSSAWNILFKYRNKSLLVLGLFAVTSMFLGLRYCCNWAINDSTPNSVGFVVKTLFDTLSRIMGISPGDWNGTSISERQLLNVIGIFAFLFSSLFSGSLYEEQFIEPNYQYKFNSLTEFCSYRLSLGIPHNLITYFPLKERYNFDK